MVSCRYFLRKLDYNSAIFHLIPYICLSRSRTVFFLCISYLFCARPELVNKLEQSVIFPFRFLYLSVLKKRKKNLFARRSRTSYFTQFTKKKRKTMKNEITM